MHKVFSVQMLVSNTGTRPRKLEVSVPSASTRSSLDPPKGLNHLYHQGSTPCLDMDPQGTSHLI